MQPKVKIPGLKIAVLLAVAVAIGGVVALMKVNIPAPQHSMVKQLDAKDFLGQK